MLSWRKANGIARVTSHDGRTSADLCPYIIIAEVRCEMLSSTVQRHSNTDISYREKNCCSTAGACCSSKPHVVGKHMKLGSSLVSVTSIASDLLGVGNRLNMKGHDGLTGHRVLRHKLDHHGGIWLPVQISERSNPDLLESRHHRIVLQLVSGIHVVYYPKRKIMDLADETKKSVGLPSHADSAIRSIPIYIE